MAEEQRHHNFETFLRVHPENAPLHNFFRDSNVKVFITKPLEVYRCLCGHLDYHKFIDVKSITFYLTLYIDGGSMSNNVFSTLQHTFPGSIEHQAGKDLYVDFSSGDLGTDLINPDMYDILKRILHKCVSLVKDVERILSENTIQCVIIYHGEDASPGTDSNSVSSGPYYDD